MGGLPAGTPVPDALAGLSWPWVLTGHADRHAAATELSADPGHVRDAIDALDRCLGYYTARHPAGPGAPPGPAWVQEHWGEIREGLCARFTWLTDVTWPGLHALLSDHAAGTGGTTAPPDELVRSVGLSWVAYVVRGVIDGAMAWLQGQAAVLRGTPDLDRLLTVLRDALRVTTHPDLVPRLANAMANTGRARAYDWLADLADDDTISAPTRAEARHQADRVRHLVEDGGDGSTA